MILGNFIADHVKGSDFLKFSPQIKEGITMHRAIDTFTDQELCLVGEMAQPVKGWEGSVRRL